jgi:hypothetical protein
MTFRQPAPVPAECWTARLQTRALRLSGLPVRRTAADRLATIASEGDDDESRVLSSYTIVRDRAGRPEYLCASGRAYRRQPETAALGDED